MTRTAALPLILLLIAVAWPTGCASTDGKSYPETNGLEFKDNVSEIEGKYEIFGEIRAEGPKGCTREFLMRQMVKQGMERGADVIVVGELQNEDLKTEHGRKPISFAIGRLVKYK